MTKNIQEAIKIAMELMVFAVVVLFVYIGVNFSDGLNDKRLVEENLAQELQKQSLLYSYDSGYKYDENNAVVVEPRVLMNGDDILLLATKYAKELDIRVQMNCVNDCSCLYIDIEDEGVCVCSPQYRGCSICLNNPTLCSCIVLNSKTEDSKWSTKNLKELLGNNISDTFIPILDKDENGVVRGVIFYNKNKQNI